MKHAMKRTAALLLAAASILTVPALAAPEKSKADKAEKKSLCLEIEKTPEVHLPQEAPDREASISDEQARQIALEDAGVEADTLKYVTCYLSWADHAPYAYEVKFSTRTEHYHYTIDLSGGTVLDSSCLPRR